MSKYKNLHLWMIIPMAVMQLGIFYDYWGDFSENAWSVHVHYWTGTAWYLFLIFQPYFATHGQIVRHRTLGMIGIFVAGGVCLTAQSMLYRDIASAKDSIADPQRFAPFEPWFFYGIASIEFVMMVAFGFAVIMSIIHRKEIENHSWWLITTVFIIMNPALGRGIGFLWFTFQMQDVGLLFPIYIAQVIIIGMLLIGAWKFGTLRHRGTYLALGVNLFIFLLEPIGRSTAVAAFLQAVIKN
jgi:hypothetical protein